MKNNRFIAKTASFLSAVSLFGALSLPVSAASETTDLPNNYAKKAIEKLLSEGIMTKNDNGFFNPTGQISRQDFAIVLARTLSLDLTVLPSKPTFEDVPSNHYAYSAVEAAAKAGLIKGIKNDQLGGTQKITREQMAVMFVRALQVDPTSARSGLIFTDANSISPWARDSVRTAVEYGLMVGSSDGSFNPDKMASRQDMALVTVKFLNEKAKLTDQNNQSNAKPTAVPAPIPVPVFTPAPITVSKPVPAPNPTPVPVPDPTPVPVPDPTPVPVPDPTPVPVPDPTPVPVPDPTPVPVPDPTPVPVPDPTPVPVPDPTPVPVPDPTPVPVPDPTPIENQAPVVSNLKFFDEQGNDFVTAVEVGTTVKIDFDYSDAENDPPKNMYYKWYRSSDSEATNKELIPDANIYYYTPEASDVGKYLTVEVVPYAASGTEIGSSLFKTMAVPVSPQVTRPGDFGFLADPAISFKEYEEGSRKIIRFDYFPKERFINGTLEVTIEGVTFTTADYYNLSDDASWQHFQDNQITNDGHTVTLTNANIFSQNDVAFELGGSIYPAGKIIPSAGSYKITLKADADGEGPKLPGSEQIITIISKPSSMTPP